jgi:hypothetical protein
MDSRPGNPNGKTSFKWGLSLFISTICATMFLGFLIPLPLLEEKTIENEGEGGNSER